jgi:hypothetical protein
MNPPKRAVVFSFDEKTQVQALGPDPAITAHEEGQRRHDDP